MRIGVGCRRLAVFASFEFDLGTLELRKNGTRLRLEDKPARALACLLEHAGILVERADLVELLWPGESHGDFHQRLNKAVNKLRLILSDNPSAPRFIQTLNRREYRFVADVQILDASSKVVPVSEPLVHASSEPDALAVTESVPRSELAHLRQQPRSRWRQWSLSRQATVAVLAIAVCLILGFGSGMWRVVANMKVRRSVAVVGFRNLTGNQTDAWLSSAISDWLATDLSAGDGVRMIPEEDLARAQFDIGSGSSDHPSRETLSSMRKSLGADLVVSGALATVQGESGDLLRMDVRVQDTRSGDMVRSFTLVGARSGALQLASDAGLRLRSELGLEPLSPQALNLVRASLPTNPDAARLYTEGVAALQNYDAVEASALLVQASSIEPQHVPTHAALAATWEDLGYDERARAEAESAFSGAKDLPRGEQLLMEGLFRETTKDWDGAVRVYGELFRLYPDDIDYGLKLANSEISEGKAMLALGTVEAMRQLREPPNEDPRLDLTEAAAAASISDFKRQQDAAVRAESAARKLGAKLLVAHSELEEGSALRSLGNLPEALKLWRQARETFTAAGDRRGVAKSLNDEGVLLWQKGDGPAAAKTFHESITLSRASGDQATLAFALSRLGIVEMYSGKRDPSDARRLFHEALDIYRRVENVQEQGYIVSLIADEALQRDRFAEAKTFYEESLALSRSVNDRSRVAGRLMDIGIVDTMQGDLAGANDSLEQSLSIYRELGEKNRVALVQNRLALVMLWEGKISQADSIMESSLATAREIGEANVVAEMHENQASIEMEEDPAKAASSAMAAMACHQSNGDRHGVAMDSAILAQAHLQLGNIAESYASLAQAFQILGPNPPGELGIQMFVVRARLHARNRQLKAARTDLVRATMRARNLGAGSMEMEARLAMAELELKSRDKNAHHDVDALLRDASKRGFGLITAQAAKALHTSVQLRS